MMSKGIKEEFRRLRQEHARLHDPVGLRSSVELVPVPEGPQAPPATTGGGAVVIEPAEIICRLDAFYDRSFEVVAPRARKVELLWRRGGDFRRAAMDHGHHDRFAATVGMEDGEYLFAYEVDGRTAPDARHAQRLLLCREGVFAPLRLERYGRTLALRNVGEDNGILWVETRTPWLEAGAERTLPAGHEMLVPVRLLPERMEPGENRGELHVGVLRTGEDEVPHDFPVPVTAELTTGGAVPIFTFSPADLGDLIQGGELARLEVKVEARGRGALRGMITLAHTSEVADFILEAEGEPRRFSHVFNVDSAHLPCRERGAVTVTLINDCYLADRRLFRAEVPYRLTYLKKSLPVMNFGAVRQGFTKTMRLEVARSDGEEVELEVSLPDSAVPHLECHIVRSGVYVFRFRAPARAPGTPLEGDVILTDRRSELQDRIKFMAEVAEGGAGGRHGGHELSASTARN